MTNNPNNMNPHEKILAAALEVFIKGGGTLDEALKMYRMILGQQSGEAPDDK